VVGGQTDDCFAEAVRIGLGSMPKWLPCRYFYDTAGSRLFERICDLPEYYLTRIEERLLRTNRREMVERFGTTPVIVELGSGSSRKTRWLLEAACARFGTIEYMPIDVSGPLLKVAAEALTDALAGLRVTALVGDYRAALDLLRKRRECPRLFLFLGSSLGNYERDSAIALLRHIHDASHAGDRLLLGTDLVKDAAILEAAYNDASGLTAQFNKNLLLRINRELGGRFDVGSFIHRAHYDAARSRVEMHLVSRHEQQVRIDKLGMVAAFSEGETIHTENSHKYTITELQELAAGSGFVEELAWTDEAGWYRVQMWRRV
jgi:dimethylhistidine N-methyltransferase